MEEAQDYYSFLGVSHNATIDDIKRAFHRKRKEYQNDEQKTLQLNIAFQFLIDEAERKKYDREHPYENRIRELKEIIKNSEDQESVRNSFLELKKIYEEILCQDAENLEALVTLCNIAAILENQEVFSYLVRIEQYARTLTDSSEALECWRFLVEKYEKYEKYDEAIRLLSHVCRENADDVEDVVYLARLFYERKGDLKAALSLLNESINHSDISSSIMHYLCESLRAICIMKTENNAQVKELYKKIESLILESYSKNDRASANELANKLLIYMNDFLVTQNISVIHHLEKLYMLCLPCAQERSHIFEILQQTVKAMESGKIHKAVSLFLGGKFTSDIRKKIAYYISDDAAGIKASIEYIKGNIPAYWESIEEEQRTAFEKDIEDNLTFSKELYDMRNDTSISMDLKEAFECFIIAPIINDKKTWDKGCELVSTFIKNTRNRDPKSLQIILQKLELFYPNSYENLSAIFFEGKSTEEIFGIPRDSALIDNVPLAKAGDADVSSKGDAITVREKRKFRWWRYFFYGLGLMILGEELESGNFPFWGITVILGIYLFTRWKKDKQPTEEEVKAKEEKKNAAKHVRKKMFKRFGIGFGIFGLVSLIALLVLQSFPKDADSLQIARSMEQDGQFDESYQVFDEPQQTEDTGDTGDTEDIDNSFLVAYPDGDESKTPVKYIEDSGLSWEEEKALAAEQRPALIEYLGCSEDNLWSTGVRCMQENVPKVTFWYVDDYNGSTELQIILLDDGTAAWYEDNVSYVQEWNDEDMMEYDTRMEGEFAVYTIEKDAFKDMQSFSNTLNTRTLSESIQKAKIAEYMGWNDMELSFYGVNDAGRKDFKNNSDDSYSLAFLLDDGTVAMHNEGEAPYRVIGNQNSLSEFSLVEQQAMVEEYLGCSEGHIKYSYSTDNVDGDIRPLFRHIEGDMTERDLYLADDFTVRKLDDYQERTSETVDRNYFHINTMADYGETYGY